MSRTLTIFRRELRGYFATPVAYVFIVVFLFLTGRFAFEQGSFFERGQADLQPFFLWHPWLYLILIPSITMRLWAEERKSGTLEVLFTLPVSMTQAVLGKFLAAWCFTAIALALTFPMWLTVNYLGSPDNGVILAGYLGSLLMAGSYLAIGSFVSAFTRNQVIAFVLGVVLCFGFIMSGYPIVLNFFSGWAPQFLVDLVSSFSLLTHFDSISRGVLDIRDLIFFVSLAGFFLFANAIVISLKKGK